jgi:hypothetical protein
LRKIIYRSGKTHFKNSTENAKKLSTEAAKRTSKSRPKMPKNYPPKQRNTLKKSDKRAKKLSTGQKKGTKKRLPITNRACGQVGDLKLVCWNFCRYKLLMLSYLPMFNRFPSAEIKVWKSS